MTVRFALRTPRWRLAPALRRLLPALRLLAPPGRRLGAPILLSALAAGCAVGPDYRRPAIEAPPAFTEAGPWKTAEPRDALAKPDWWKVFRDPVLDGLESEAAAASPTLKAALARYDAAVAVAQISRAALLPDLSANPNASRARYSANRQTPTPATQFAYTTNSFEVPLDLNYELDVFGKARRALESAREAAAAQGALYQNVLLTLEAGVAQNYFALRSLRSQQDILRQNVALLQDTLDLVVKLRRGGANSDLDVFQAQAQLEGVRSTALATDRAFAEQLHTLAVLVGRTPESFSVDAEPVDGEPPDVPVGLPSDLLERRPDVAAAERSLASVNAQIGVAKAAFFPSIALTAFGGYNSTDLSTLFQSASREWGFGPSINIPIFEGGLLRAQYRIAKANYDAAAANYREQVLVAFGEVEDGLSDLRYLSQQREVLGRAVDSSQKALDLSTLRYKNGISSYLEVIDAQRTLLQNQLTLTDVRAQRLVATVLLVKAVGGGWQTN